MSTAFALFHIVCAARGVQGCSDERRLPAVLVASGRADAALIASYQSAMPIVIVCLLLGAAHLAAAYFLFAVTSRLSPRGAAHGQRPVAVNIMSIVPSEDPLASEFIGLLVQAAALSMLLLWSTNSIIVSGREALNVTRHSEAGQGRSKIPAHFGLALILAGCATPNGLDLPSARRILAGMKSAAAGQVGSSAGVGMRPALPTCPRPGMPMKSGTTSDPEDSDDQPVGGRVVRHAGYMVRLLAGEAQWARRGRARPRQTPPHRRDAYLSSAGWFFPGRFQPKLFWPIARFVDGAPHYVLRIKPADAEPFGPVGPCRNLPHSQDRLPLKSMPNFPIIGCSRHLLARPECKGCTPAHEIVLTEHN